jgi:hypothetical protein
MVLSEEEKNQLKTEVSAKFINSRYYVLNDAERSFCELSESPFFKGFLKNSSVTINQYIYLHKAVKEKPIKDYQKEAFYNTKQAFLNQTFLPIQDTEDRQTLRVFVNRFFFDAQVWDWGKTLKKTFHYECLYGDKIIIVDCGRFSANLKLGQVCTITGKILHRHITINVHPTCTTVIESQIEGEYYLPYLCKPEVMPGNVKQSRNDLDMVNEKSIKTESGFNILL